MKNNKIKKKCTQWNYNMSLKSVVVSQAEKNNYCTFPSMKHKRIRQNMEIGDKFPILHRFLMGY
ncbi:hypothetical protein [Allomuricauda sp. CP2A]|jgi:hypothetical protein|uniref:hypothetical protein n=1 Tax=Allomuricauda sp. CP2A TaxID=1848189 RepID=UPI00082D8632|nr:hypothetical protein [Muricauda sp. CP2A]